MKILSAKQIREADAYTIKQEPILSINLMERAATACLRWLLKRIDANERVEVYCGQGNNGGDGLAIARMLSAKGYKVAVYILQHSDKSSEDFRVNEQRLKDTDAEVHYISDAAQMQKPAKDTWVIDAILGSGLNKPVEGFLAKVIYTLNTSKARIISIDLPSGLFADDNEGNKDNIIRAYHTLTFQSPKLSFMFPGSAAYVGDFTVLDISLNSDFILQSAAREHFITRYDIQPILMQRGKFSHKGTYGHALITAGSFGRMGAAVLAGMGCMRAGAGLLTLHVPKCGYHIVQTALPEAMAIVDEGEQFITEVPPHGSFDAVGIGPGLSREERTQVMLKLLIQNSRIPLVLDADALNILGENKTWISFLPAGSILTPHPKEFERLAGQWKNDNDRFQLHRNFAVKHNVYVVLKGAHTAVACPDGHVYFNSTGNPGMATGGSGDVLTGIITGLVAQGYAPREACVLGVYVHGLAGDFAASAHGEEGTTATLIAAHLGDAWKYLRSNDSEASVE
jgi:NAD(P)H-hydrate epimerase